MRLQIVAIADRGVPNKERLHLKAIVDLDLAYVVVLRSRYLGPTNVSANSLPAFWFPPRQVRMGDSIILYTGAGPVTQEASGDGTTNYFYHWGFPQTIFHDPEACVVVVDVNSWQTSARAGATPNQ